jgi:L-ribulose-5-phosphate 3-epimerase
MAPLDRRRLLAAGAALGAAWARPARAARARRDLRIALKYGMFGAGASVRERFEVARAAGFEGVEMDSPSELDLDEVLAARDATGLAIPGVVDSVHWNDTLSHPDAEVRARGSEALVRALEDCARLGGTSVLLVPAVVTREVSYDQAWERSTAELARVLPRAEELGVAIAIENVWNQFLLSPLEAARYLDQFESPAIGFHFDVGNVVTYGWPEHWVRILGRRILKLDVKEYSRARRDAEGLWKGFQVEIGEGDCGWPAVVAALDEVGYTGWATAEVPGGDARRLADVAARMRRVLGL